MKIGVYIETGGINTLTISDSIIDQLAALYQSESQSRSENIKFGIRHRMRSGTVLLNSTIPNSSAIPRDTMAYCRSFPRKPKSSEWSLTSLCREAMCGKSRSI